VSEYRIQVHDSPTEIPAADWDALLGRQKHPTPFMRHAYLSALEASGSATPATGWDPKFLTLWHNGDLHAGLALYLKSHSYGEYVFDWAWADAHHRHRLPYYPKALAAVPFTPVPGTRLLARDEASRAALAEALRQLTKEFGLSSAHLLFMDGCDEAALASQGWLIREGLQFHWMQDPEHPVMDFSQLLSGMHRHKRKNIVQERRRVADAGVSFTIHEGSAIDEGLWDFFYRCYCGTYAAHHSSPYLSRDFFSRMARDLPEHWVLFVARRQGQPVAASLIAIDRGTGWAWGRYWGATESIPCLHFEACYYQPLAWCIAQGFNRFEGGAQGEHKMARGLLPVRTASAHWIRDVRFEAAIADFLTREGTGIEAYADELRDRSPFRKPSPEAV
jgi:predicted N-acyltransferase